MTKTREQQPPGGACDRIGRRLHDRKRWRGHFGPGRRVEADQRHVARTRDVARTQAAQQRKRDRAVARDDRGRCIAALHDFGEARVETFVARIVNENRRPGAAHAGGRILEGCDPAFRRHERRIAHDIQKPPMAALEQRVRRIRHRAIVIERHVVEPGVARRAVDDDRRYPRRRDDVEYRLRLAGRDDDQPVDLAGKERTDPPHLERRIVPAQHLHHLVAVVDADLLERVE